MNIKSKKLKSILSLLVLSLGLTIAGCSNDIDGMSSASKSTTENTEQMENTNADGTESLNSTDVDGDEPSGSIDEEDSTESSVFDVSSDDLPEGSIRATVDRVVDGDTIKLKLNGEIITLRLLLIDTPESVKPGVEAQPFSIEASNYAKELLKAGDEVYIEYDTGDKTDKYDRHLAYLYYKDSDSSWKMFNQSIIREGYARVGYIYSQKRHLDTLYLAQDKAKKEKKNIWSIDGYVTDSGYNIDAISSNKTNSSSSSSNVSNSNESSEDVVYANGGASKSNKYHSSSNAHNMKGAIKMTEKEAKSQGYVPCGLCY